MTCAHPETKRTREIEGREDRLSKNLPDLHLGGDSVIWKKGGGETGGTLVGKTMKLVVGKDFVERRG